MADSVKIRITGDDSEFRKTLSGIGPAVRTSIRGLSIATGALSSAISAVGLAGIKYNASIESLQASFETMTGSAQKAVDIVSELRDLGASTPYEFAGLAETVQALMQYNISADAAIDATKMIGDIAQGSAEKMSRISMAYGQMSSSGKVHLEDVKQMIEAGFNPLLVISEKTGVSMSKLYERISKGQVTVEEITDAMITATSEGGRFFQSMEKQSQTLNGQISTLKDNLQSFGGTLFTGVSEIARTQVIPFANAMVEEMQAAFEEGGVDGLIDAFSKRLPQLTAAAVKAAQGVLSGVAKKLPTLLNGIFQALPSVLESGFTFAVDLTDALFDMADQAIKNLISHFPEYAPIILEGLKNLAVSVVSGLNDIIVSAVNEVFGVAKSAEDRLNDTLQTMFDGIDEAKKATMKAEITAEIDSTSATTTINAAVTKLETALGGFGLSDTQVKAIKDMIGEDYNAIYSKCKEFGLSDEDAAVIAGQVEGINGTVADELNKLSIAMPASELIKLITESNGNRAILINSLKNMGLTAPEINGVVAVFNGINGTLSENLTSMTDTIATTLTDGKADTAEVVGALVANAQSYYDGVKAEIDKWEEIELMKLDPGAEGYAEDVATIKSEADSMRTTVEEAQTATVAFVDEMAGKSAESVNARLGEFDAIEARVDVVAAKLDAATELAASQEAQAFEVVRAGARADEKTIGMALDFAFDSYKLDEQSLEDQYDAAIAEANAKLANNPNMTTEEYNEIVMQAQITLDAGLAENTADYESKIRQIFAGIADSLPDDVADPLIEAVGNIDLANQIMEMVRTEGFSAADVSQEMRDLYEKEIGAVDWDSWNLKGSYLQFGFDKIVEDLLAGTAEGIAAIDGTPLATALATVIEEGMFSGTSFEGITENDDYIVALLQGMVNNNAATLTAGETEITAGAETAVSGVPDAMDKSAEAKTASANTVSGYVSNIYQSLGLVSKAGGAMGSAFIGGLKRTLQVRSPSRVTMQIGEYTGQGFEIGVVDSMKHAVKRAEGIVGAMNLSTKVTAPDLSGAFYDATQGIADIEAGRPIVLNINGKTFAEVTAQNTRSAQNARNKSIALGVGK